MKLKPLASFAATIGLLVALSGCAATYTEADFGGYKSCSPSYKANTAVGNFSVQQAGAGRSLQWGAYPKPQYSGTRYVVTVNVNNKRYDKKDQTYAPHGSVNQATAQRNSGKKLQITGTIYRGDDTIRFTIGCIIK